MKVVEKKGRKLKRSESQAPTVQLINAALDKLGKLGSLKAVADAIEHSYTALADAYHETRPLPVMPFLRLCLFLGMSEKQAIQAYDEARKYKKTIDK